MTNDRPHETTLRFLAAPTEVGISGDHIHGGRVMEWIDKAAYACAVAWSESYCVTAYVGNVNFTRPINSGDLVEVVATLIHTGRSSMQIRVTVGSASPRGGALSRATDCLVIFVAVDGNGRSTPVTQFTAATDLELRRQADAISRIAMRGEIERAMSTQQYTDDGTGPRVTLRFLAAPTDVNWGGKTHGGTVMRWIDEAGYVCGTGWCHQPTVAVYSGGIRFYRPVHIGHLVEVESRLIYTGRHSMHIATHVRSADPRSGEMALTTHSLSIFVALDGEGHAIPIPTWAPVSEEDLRLHLHAQELVTIRGTTLIPDA